MSGIIGDLTPKCAKGLLPLTGLTSCMKFEGRPLGFIFTDFNDKFLATSDIVAALRDKLRFQTLPGATIVVNGLVNLEPTGGDIRLNQEGFGAASINGLNPLQEVYTITEGGLCMYKELRKLNGRKLRVIFIDAEWLGYFTAIQHLDAANIPQIYLRGYNITLGVTRRKNIDTTPGAIILTFVYDPAFEREDENMASIPLSSDLQGLVGIKFMRTGSTTMPTPSITGKLVTSCDNSDVPTEIALSLTTAMVRLLNGTGDEVMPSSVAVSPDGVITLTVPMGVAVATTPIKILSAGAPSDWLDAYLIGDDTFHV